VRCEWMGVNVQAVRTGVPILAVTDVDESADDDESLSARRHSARNMNKTSTSVLD
jgi:hypothetical protein